MLYRAKAGNPEVQRVDARGKVRLVTPSERGSADIGIYDIDGRIITMTGNVSLDRGGSILKGQRLVINLDTGQSSIDARSAARPGQPAGRVTGRFTVPARR